jgi:undecaprenyl-diphosphatase
VVVGLAYALAVLPGLSAVAAAYVVARWLGVPAWRAVETALVVSFPALAFGSIRSLVAEGTRLETAGVAIALVVAFVAALLGASLWRAICDRRRTALLALWLVPLALAILAYGRALPHPTTDLPLSVL